MCFMFSDINFSEIFKKFDGFYTNTNIIKIKIINEIKLILLLIYIQTLFRKNYLKIKIKLYFLTS